MQKDRKNPKSPSMQSSVLFFSQRSEGDAKQFLQGIKTDSDLVANQSIQNPELNSCQIMQGITSTSGNIVLNQTMSLRRKI